MTFIVYSMVIILLVVAIHGPQLDDEFKGPSSEMWSIVKPGIPSAIGVISFAYVCHHNSRAFAYAAIHIIYALFAQSSYTAV
jgi:sodium-coupled neutral amino acid transporter 11